MKITSPESLRLWQKRVGSLSGIPQFPPVSDRPLVLAGLKEALWRAGPEYVATAMLKLQAHYWRPDFSPAQAKELYADYIEDLSDLPPDILDAAIGQYRRNPESKFFPRTGELLGFAAPMLEERRRAVLRLERGPGGKPQEQKRSPAEIDRMRNLVKTAFRRTDEASA